MDTEKSDSAATMWSSNMTRAAAEDEDFVYYNPLDVSKSMEWKILNDCIIYIAPILIFFGTFGNILSFIILWKRKDLNTTTVYLLTLAVLDQIILSYALVHFWINHTFPGTDYKLISHGGCVLTHFVVHTLFICESWVLVNLTLERLVAVYLPHKSKIIFTKRKAAIGLVLTFIPIIALNLHWFFTSELYILNAGTPYEFRICAISDWKHVYWMREVWPMIYLMVQSAIPFSMLFLCNVLIIIRANLRGKDMNTTVQNKMSSMTTILLVISFTFLFLSLPFVVSNKVLNNYLQSLNYSYERSTTLVVTQRACSFLSYLVYVLNFYQYFFSSPRFRRELFIMFGIEKPKEVTSSMATSTMSVTVASTTKVDDTKM